MAKLKPFDPLAAVRKAPLKVTSFELNPAALRNDGYDCPPVEAFPTELLACTNLKHLELFRGIAGDPTIPPEIGRLKKLETLSLGGLELTSLPNAIGGLASLRDLDLVYSESLRALPDTIGLLKNLRRLSVSYTAVAKLPKAIGKLTKLEELSAASSKLREVPAELWNARELRALALPEGVTKLPPGIGKLTKLEALALSGSALASIASELPKLTRLRVLSVDGKAASLPANVGSLRALCELNIGYLGLRKLPESLSNLESLEALQVSGNALTHLAADIARLPKLKSLEFSGNPLVAGEKKQIEALMRMSPKKRAAALVAPPPKANGAKKKPVAKPAPSKLVGTVTSINNSLNMLVADAPQAAAFQGIDNQEDDDGGGSDWDRLSDALKAKKWVCATFDLAGAEALALSLGVSGRAYVYRVGSNVVLFEGTFESSLEDLEGEDKELFDAFVASPPSPKAKKVGEVAAPSGWLVLMPSTDSCTDVKKLLAKPPSADGVKCGDEKCGLMMRVDPNATLSILLEREVESAWGSGRRAVLVPPS